ncbi:MAG: c-type cytochrome [Anaerolineales bacterium]|nr:c-type cytochrome [Anaerolineales bacterium]
MMSQQILKSLFSRRTIGGGSRRFGVIWNAFILFALLFVLILTLPHSGHAQTSEDPVEIGRILYGENCAVCHGLDGQGRVGAQLAKDWPSLRPDRAIASIIANGISGSAMPAWSQSKGGPLRDDQIEAIVAYILTWESGGPRILPPTPTPVPRPPLTPPPDIQGDPNRGATLYDQNCAVCHGANLEGRVGATLAKNWPSIRPDQSIRNVIANGIQGSAMPAWSKAKGGPLSEREIDDLVAFILTQAKPAEAFRPTPAPAFQPSWLSGWGGALLTIVLFLSLIHI